VGEKIPQRNDDGKKEGTLRRGFSGWVRFKIDALRVPIKERQVLF